MPYMWKVSTKPKYIFDEEDSYSQFIQNFYLEAVRNCSTNSEEFQRYLNWKVIDERGL